MWYLLLSIKISGIIAGHGGGILELQPHVDMKDKVLFAAYIFGVLICIILVLDSIFLSDNRPVAFFGVFMLLFSSFGYFRLSGKARD